MEELYLGIETSCDDTSCAIYSPARGVVTHRTAACSEPLTTRVTTNLASRA